MPGDPIVATQSGAILGTKAASGDTLLFAGIPYAAPPIGAGRWKPPQTPTPWKGVRDGSLFGPAPIQQSVHPNPLFPLEEEPQDEDCLTLNIWTGSLDDRRPVIVWFPPGAFQAGSGSARFYHGDRWARAGAVFVTFNYRLSRLGFLALPELSGWDGSSGNYGVLDQVAVLEWVRDNIAAFGGDPACVTIFGISSGASSVSLLMASPAARGLFHRAIAESGGSFGPVGETTGIGDTWQTLEAAERSGEAWARSIGAAWLGDLCSLDATRVRTASILDSTDTQGLFNACRPVIDGRVLIAGSREVFAAREQANVPLLVGSAGNESLGTGFAKDLAAYIGQARREHGADFDEFISLYPAATDTEAVGAALFSNGHRLFSWQNWIWANMHAAAGHPVYYYRFEKAPPAAAHGASIFYSFSRFDLRRNWSWQPNDWELSDALVRTWIDFARTGRTGPSGGVDWPRFDPAVPRVMRIGATWDLGDIPEQRYLDFWDRRYRR